MCRRSRSAAEAAGCELELDLRDEGADHIGGGREPEYATSPPTSGPPAAVPLADGAYLSAPEPRHWVHSMEHGRVVIHYGPEVLDAIRAFRDEFRGQGPEDVPL